ncbi:DUF4157 domain-containing protein [Mucilaginibacter sp. RCC_168]|uniref:eCIS core domain-containing protein n=1 Tax=Mucilaginibacter sp. RCC_168 TaxID=3239221 RepID=UPI0035238FAB
MLYPAAALKNNTVDRYVTKTTDTPGKKKTCSNHVFFQPKLTVNQPHDVYEQEADTMADRVMRMAIPDHNENAFFKPVGDNIQRKCQHCEEEEKVHRKERSGAEAQGSHELDSYVGSLGSSGQALPESSRQFFEPRFGRDFSNVRIHTDSVAAKSAQSINALAYTTGNNIVFNNGQFSPESDSGKKLMAHELTHVVQQGEGVVRRYGHDNFCKDDLHLKPFIWSGHPAAVQMLANVLAAFTANDPRLTALIPKYFGTEGLAHRSEIEANFKKINTKLNENYMYHCNDGANANSSIGKCNHAVRAETDINGFFPTNDIMLCFDIINSSWSATDVGALIVHENYHRAMGGSVHAWGLGGNPPDCGSGSPPTMKLLLDNPDSYSCLARLF